MNRVNKIRLFFQTIFSGHAIIPWMLIVAIIPMCFVSFFAYHIAKTILHQAININLMTTIQKKIEVIDSYIRERKIDLYQISELPTLLKAIQNSQAKNGQIDVLDPNLMAPFSSYLNYLSKKIGINNVYILNLSGKVIYTLKNDAILGTILSADSKMSMDVYSSYEGAKILREPYLFATHQEGRRSSASDIFLSRPVMGGGSLKAIIVIRINAQKIETIIDRLLGYGKSEETLLATLINNTPVVVMYSKEGIDEKNIDILDSQKIQGYLLQAIRGESSTPVELEGNGKGIMAVYRYVPQLNMGMLLKYDRSEVFERIHWLGLNMLLFIVVSLLFVVTLVFWISRELSLANQKNEDLLANTFPDFVIKELKHKKQFLAKNVDHVSIIFIDIADFTTYSLDKPPEIVVQFLDNIFTLFDQICGKYNAMKIKTIGDAYMAASGLTEYREDHAKNTVDLGIQIILAMKHFNLNHKTNFSVRVGIDSGMITEGVIGKTKFSFDIWGNAVNRASRMQSTSEKNKIQITEETFQALTNKEDYTFTPRSNLTVKGLGELNTYFVEEKDSANF